MYCAIYHELNFQVPRLGNGVIEGFVIRIAVLDQSDDSINTLVVHYYNLE